MRSLLALFVLVHAALAEPNVRVTAEWRNVNGQTTVPRGLLGLHADTGLTAERVREWGVGGFRQIHYIPGSGSVAFDKTGNVRELFRELEVVVDCQGDRFVPAEVLTNPNYVHRYRQIGRDYARQCKENNWPGYAEFWNEPYLNWAERSRKNYDPKFYDVGKATDDGPVTIRGWDKPLKYLRWRRLWAQSDETGKINYLVPVPKDAKAGDKFTHTLHLYFAPQGPRNYTVVEKWDVYDPTAVSFWSGKQNYEFYMWMFLPWAQAIKETNPAVQVVGGWDFSIWSDNWQSWELLYRPMIDDGIQWLDAICEHHYGSNSRATAGSYEVAVGYAMSKYGKRLRCLNTETAGCVDPAVPGAVHANATPYGAFNYGLRDIVELWCRCPDKAVARAAHGSLAKGWGGGGDEFLFKLLKDVRGRFVHAASDDLDVWPVASCDGTNLVVVIFNDHRQDQTIRLALAAPSGFELGKGRQVWVTPIASQGPIQFNEAEVPASGRSFTGTVNVAGQTGVKLLFPLTGRPVPMPELRQEQFHAPGVLRQVPGGDAVSAKIRLPPETLRQARAARLKLVLEGVHRGEASVRINGAAPLPIPNHDWITEIEVPVAGLREENVLLFQSAGDGYQLDLASLVLDLPASVQ